MRRNWYDVKAMAGQPAAISIYDEIGAWGVTAKQFLAEFNAIESNDVDLEINSPGGSVFDALAMFNGMKLSGKNITVRVMGIAASAASYIAMVGNKIIMPDNTFMMVHNPLNGLYGNADDFREMADILDKVGNSLTSTYVARTGKSVEEVAALLKAETYLTAAECLALGFCDEVTPAVAVSAKFEREDLPTHIQALLKPVAVVPPVPEPVPEPVLVAFADQVVAAAAAAQMPQFSTSWAVRLSDMAAVTARIAEVREIAALCAVAKAPEKVDGFVNAGKTIAEVRSALCDTLAASDKLVDTTAKIGNEPSTTGVQPSALSTKAIWAARRNPKGAK